MKIKIVVMKRVKKMKISRFIHIIDNNNVWDAVSRRKIALSEEEINYIRKNKNKDVIECSN